MAWNQKEYNAKWKKEHPEKTRAYIVKWKKNHPEKAREINRICNLKWARANPEKVRVSNAKWRKANPEKAHASTNRWMQKNKERVRAVQSIWYAKNKEKEKVKYMQRREEKKLIDKKTKLECFRAYGEFNPKCACCGESQYKFLSIDHVNNDGHLDKKTDRKRRRGGIGLYRYLRKRGFPDKDRYQVLCMNCNHGKMLNNGICPHKDSILSVVSIK
jgi:hypothetical protein